MDTHGYDTWRKPEGDGGHLWLADELPKRLPRARVMLEYYDSSPLSFTRRESVIQQAKGILDDIWLERQDIKVLENHLLPFPSAV